MPLARATAEFNAIASACLQWSQGDLALSEKVFVHVCDPSRPLTSAADGEAESPFLTVESEIDGLMVVTQTCDIRRDCLARPYVEVCPLVQVESDALEDVRKWRRVSLVTTTTLAIQGLAADLDRVMTVEKSLLATWERTPGCENESEAKRLAWALGRKRERFAFPNEFVKFAEKLTARLKAKHGKVSPEGEALQSLEEIRVSASPSWDGNPTDLMFWFVRKNGTAPGIGKFLPEWLKLVPADERFTKSDGVLVFLSEMSAEDYLNSERLDLDHLSLT